MIILIPMTHNTASQQLIIKDSQISDLSNKKEKKQIESESLWEREQSYKMWAADRAVLVKACVARRSTGQGLRGCDVSPWAWLCEDWGAVPCSDFSGLQAPAKREPLVFQPPGKAKLSLRQSRSSLARSRLAQPSISLAVRNANYFFFLNLIY